MRTATLFVVVSLLLSCQSTNPPASAAGGVRAPVVITRVAPEYPRELQAEGVHGAVTIGGAVPKEGGHLRNPHVIASDDSRLNDLALKAIAKWVWAPGTQNGEPVDVEFRTTVTFWK